MADPLQWRTQFAHPRGVLGWLVGHAMARKNRERGAWVIETLAPAPGDRVLEVGCGPGVDLVALSERAGEVVGVDISREMVRQATARARWRGGRVAVQLGSVEALPVPDGEFDKVLAINSVQFWPDLPHGLRECQRVLCDGGVLAVAIQPRSRGANAATTQAWESRLVSALTAAGFDSVRSVTNDVPAIPVTCVMGTKPARG